MQPEEIPAEQWLAFFNDFSRTHAGRPATLELVVDGMVSHKLAEDQPLQGVSFDTKGTRPASVDISVGSSPNTYTRHVVDMPLHIVVLDDPRWGIDIEFEPAHGPRTVLHLHASPVH